jgi:uncharacterized membrane protein HdeD (DUF308 family)
MDSLLARNWGWVVLRGVLAILFGLLTIFRPAISLVVLVIFFGAYAFVDGIFNVIWSIANRREEPHWVTLLLAGLAGIAIGAITFFLPGVTATTLVILIAAWAIVIGVLEIAAAIRLRKIITGEWLLGLAGVLAIVFGVLALIAPVAGALVIVLWIGVYALISGIVLLALGFRLRRWHKARLAFGAAASTV